MFSAVSKPNSVLCVASFKNIYVHGWEAEGLFSARGLHLWQGNVRIAEGGAVVALSDKTLTCRDCGREFIFTTGEQEFYTSRGFQEPSRCPECRWARRAERAAGYNSSRPSYSVVCSACGKEATVPFEPKEGQPVYCRECYLKTRQSR